MSGIAVRILAMSDTCFYPPREYEEIVQDSKPDVIVLAGDYDETYSVWAEDSPFAAHEVARNQTLAMDFFYRFLGFASRRADVLVIGGNHEEYSASKTCYDKQRINSINNCRELSGLSVRVGGLHFVGLGYTDTLGKLQLRMGELATLNPDVLITHCELERLSLLSRLSPKLIIRGHASSGPGRFLARGVPVISAGAVRYSVITVEEHGIGVTQEPTGRNATNDHTWLSLHPFGWLRPFDDSVYPS
jgi:hypothetical protein